MIVVVDGMWSFVCLAFGHQFIPFPKDPIGFLQVFGKRYVTCN